MDYDDDNYEEMSNDSSGSEYFEDSSESEEQSWAEMGFSIEGGDLGEEGDAAGDAFFASLDGSSSNDMDSLDGIPRYSKRESNKEARIQMYENERLDGQLDDKRAEQGNVTEMGKVTPQDFLLNKISHMSYNVQAAFRDVAGGKSLSSMAGIDGQAMEVAMQEFLTVANSDRRSTSVTGESFASQIKLDSVVDATRSTQDLRTVQSMLVNIAADMNMGPGGKLMGNEITEEKRGKREDREAKAFATLDRLVEMTKGGITGQPGEANYETNVRDQIYGAAMDSGAGPTSLAWVPLPSELNRFGSVLTMSASGGPMGTGFNRTTFSDKFGSLLNRQERVDGQAATDEFGRLVPNTMALRPDLAAEMKTNMKTGQRNSDELNTYMQNAPNLKATYMPKPANFNAMDFDTRQLWTANRNSEWETFQEDLIEARQTISGLTRTTTDESNGNRYRTSAFGRPQDEQEARANAINEAHIYGIGDTEASAEDATNAIMAQQRSGALMLQGLGTGSGKGATTGGMYGEKNRTEFDVFIEQHMAGLSPDEIINDYVAEPTAPWAGVSDLDKYMAWADTQPEQGSQAWLNLRKGNVTASQAARLTGGQGTLSLGEEMAMESMGMAKDFRKNATMQRGNDLEEQAKNRFLRSEHGKGMTWAEGFFETDKNLPGFGVSPDGRMFDEGGNEAGLLEVKVLKKKNLEGALKKYHKQMQLQMKVTGESVTHFWAMDAEGSEDYIYEAVYADSELQDELIRNGRTALNVAENLNSIQDVEAHKMARKQSAPIRNKNASHLQGQQVGWIPEAIDAEEISTPWSNEWQEEVGLTNSGDKVTSKNSVFVQAAAKIAKADQRAAMLDAEEMMLNEGGKTSSRQDAQAKKDVAQSKRDDAKALKEEADARKMATTELRAYAEENKRAADSVKEFQNSVKKVVNIASELGGLVLKGNESAMDEVRFAAASGMDVDNVRGLRESLEDGGLTTQGASTVMRTAAAQTRTANDLQAGSQAWAKLQEFAAKSDSAAIRDVNFGSIENHRTMDPQARIAWVTKMSEGMNTRDKATFLQGIGYGDLAANTTSGESLANAVADVDAQGARDTYEGATDARQTLRETTELAGTIPGTAGYIAGAAAVGAETAAGLLNSTTGGNMLAMAAGSAGGNAATAALTRLAGSATAASLNLGKMTSVLGKAGLLGAAGAAGLAVGSEIADAIEGTPVGDTLVDTVGAGMNNLMAGLGNKNAQDVVNMHKLEGPSIVTRKDTQQGGKVEVENNITVNSDGSVEVETEVDGKKYMSQHQSAKPRRSRQR